VIPATERDAARFRERLAAHHPGSIMVRRTRGRDVEAACGMLHRSRAEAR
jgi:adenine C2-methylase RlmN of 23S rRNA A2503 and tRNA A37